MSGVPTDGSSVRVTTAAVGLSGLAARRPAALAALCTLLFLTFLDNTVVSVALASIRADMQAGVSALQWVVGAYALTFAALMLTFGMVGDEFGRKKVMLAGAGVYCAGAATSALAASLPMLITGRAVMGLGAAASEPGTLSMIRQLYADERSRNRALGVWAAVSGFSLALGPVLGGTLVGAWSWRGIFWFDVTFGLAALAVGVVVLPESSDPQAGRVDVPGTVLGAAAFAALVFAAINGETAGFTAAGVVALYCVSAVAAVAFVIWELRAPHPLLDLHFLRVARFATPNVIAACCYFATFAIFFFTALYLGEVAGFSGYRIAAVFLPMTIVMIAASLVAGRRTTVVGVRAPLVTGCLLFAGGLFVTNFVLGRHPAYLPLAAALGLAGAGLGASVVPVTSSVLAAVPPERSGMAASATNTSREFGAVAGVVILGALVNAELRAGLISRMTRLHLPASLQTLIIGVVQTGGGGGSLTLGGLSGGAGGTGGHGSGGSGGAGGSGGLGGAGGLIGQLFQAGYAAFESALHVALYLSAGLLAAAALLAAITLRRRRQPAASTSSSRS
jgi:EmrB/QacA subfamily drug resistance transporter